MGAGPRQPDPASLIPPEKRPFIVKWIARNDGRLKFDPVGRIFYITWTNWAMTPQRQDLTPEELPEYLTDEEIARCLAAAIAASSTP